MSTQQARLGEPADVPTCDVGGCDRPALWELTCTASDYRGLETVRCDGHRDQPEPFVGEWGVTLAFDRSRLGRGESQ